jgi:hypothetical protein
LAGTDAQPSPIRCHRIRRPAVSLRRAQYSATSSAAASAREAWADKRARTRRTVRIAAAPERTCVTPSRICRCSPNHTKPAMSLVLYPDSDSDHNDDDKAASLAPEASPTRGTPAAKRKLNDVDLHGTSALPPLPAAFHDLYATNTRTSTSDDPSLHGGRKRTVPHIEGNWPSHVYLECMLLHSCCSTSVEHD